MATEDEKGEGPNNNHSRALQVIAAIILFPFLWIGIAVNFLGLAERTSFIPGVSRKGGVSSGVVSLLLTVIILGLIMGGAAAATGAGIPLISGGDNGAAEVTPTPTPMKTQVATPTPTPAATPTSTSTPDPTPSPADLDVFMTDQRERFERNMQNETLIDIPVAAMEYRETDNGDTELWLVYRECDYQEEIKDQRFSVAVIYANSVGTLSGDTPDRIRAYGVTKLQTYSDKVTTIPTSEAEEWYNKEIDINTYTESWRDRLRSAYNEEEDIAYRMAVDELGQSTADQLFNEHYTVDERGNEACPGI